MGRSIHPPMTGGYLDRDGPTRLSPSALDAAWSDPAARLLRVRDGRMPLRAWSDREARLDLVPVFGARGTEHVYLGRAAGAPVFAIAIESDAANGGAADGDAADGDDGSEATENAEAPGRDRLPEPPGGWRPPLEFGGLLEPLEAELVAAACAILAWHGTAGFSARDGAPTSPTSGGWSRTDPHGGEHFPRMDPVVIVRVEHEERLLLGSNALWESGRFSLLAGFIDAGESAEEAVAREIFEESGLRVEAARYIASQPWPFPRSFMLGFSARLAEGVDPEKLVPDTTELSELRWFTRDELRDPPPGIRLPAPVSIARWLIDRWVAEDDASGEAAGTLDTGQAAAPGAAERARDD
ncbi:NAD(+) diphosphatase [Leucobacter soli]|uniref:NADH pyrophosphatase n=1 Tax=Leucobacter soli TaxID=2812850 RepID=A0A916NG15_9MICO|nr:NAD(+) diphosphatase [Leucobacter soli]CAG7601338.1 NADH pyrophosphatase [Leucobacter soli]